MTENVVKNLRGKQSGVAFVIGAAHTERVVELLKAENISFVVIRNHALAECNNSSSPRVDPNVYDDVFAGRPAGLGAASAIVLKTFGDNNNPKPRLALAFNQAKDELYTQLYALGEVVLRPMAAGASKPGMTSGGLTPLAGAGGGQGGGTGESAAVAAPGDDGKKRPSSERLGTQATTGDDTNKAQRDNASELASLIGQFTASHTGKFVSIVPNAAQSGFDSNTGNYVLMIQVAVRDPATPNRATTQWAALSLSQAAPNEVKMMMDDRVIEKRLLEDLSKREKSQDKIELDDEVSATFFDSKEAAAQQFKLQ